MGKTDRVKFTTRRSKKRKRFGGYLKNCINVNIVEDVDNVNIQETVNTNVNIDQPTSSTPPRTPPKNNTDTDLTDNIETVSMKKVKTIQANTPKSTDKITGYRIIDVSILDSMFSELKCPECATITLSLTENVAERRGLSSCLHVVCETCDYQKRFHTSDSHDKSYDINKRIVYSMRAIGQGYNSLETFMTLMDMPRPMTKNNYNKIASNFAKVTETVANETMEEAIGDIKEQNNESRDSMTDVAISQDGTWQRRGYSSMNGCVTAIAMDNGKVVDVEPMSRFCRGCIQMDKFKITDPEKYDHWKLKHKCQYNYQGSAGGMEVAGAERIFGRSISKHNVRYTTLYGDGDSKAHEHIVDIYPGVKVNKLQCIGHVQK